MFAKQLNKVNFGGLSLFGNVNRDFAGSASGRLLGGSKYADSGPLGAYFDRQPRAKGLSAAERLAMEQARADEDARRQRLLEMARRRSRVALGVQGGSRALLYSGFTGVGG